MAFTGISPSLQHVIRAQRAINNEMAHQLYVLQVLTFNLLEDRMMTKMDPQDQVSIWPDPVRTEEGRCSLLYLKLFMEEKTLLGVFAQFIHSLCYEAGYVFWLLEDVLCVLFAKAQQNGQAFLRSRWLHELN